MDKIIFLDIDGVLNVIPQGHDKYGSQFHKHFEENLRDLIKRTGAKIVLSSTWRMSGLSVIQEMWKVRKLAGEVIDITPCARWMEDDEIEGHDRGYEIQHWLDRNTVKCFVIIDDDTDMLPSQKNNFVKTSDNTDHEDCIDAGYGLTKQCVERAVAILNNCN
jgi:hypothetical protein